jgi:hypothetical protein
MNDVIFYNFVEYFVNYWYSYIFTSYNFNKLELEKVVISFAE